MNRKKLSFKRTLACLMVVIMTLSAVPMSGFVGLELPKWSELFATKASAAEGELKEGYYTYTVSDGKATINHVDKSISGNIAIPSTLGGYPVTSIGDSAFEHCEILTSITIPDSVTSIGSDAFFYCTGLTSVTIGDSVISIGGGAFRFCLSLTRITIPDSVTSIGSAAFVYCKSLTSVTIGDSVTSIGERAFVDCKSLTSVTIGDSVTSIGWGAFEDCTRLTSITIPDSVTSIGGCAFRSCDSLTSVTIGDSVTSIGEHAFSWCNSLKNITIPDSVTSIGNYTFYFCRKLTGITIPDSVTRIGNSAFEVCDSLTSVTIGDSVTSIGNSAFCRCRKLTEITIPDSVTSIGYSAFESCDSLTSITIPDSVTSIGNFAFESCVSLTSITIPDSVTSIGYYAFEYCYSLTSITVDSANKYYSDDGYGVLFNKDKTTLIQYPIGNSRSSYSIPDSVTSISGYAFDNCDSLTSITIPDSLTSIGNYAFYNCNSLTSITIPDSVTSIGSSAFSCTNLESVTIPDSVKSIGNEAFYNCDDLKRVTIGNGVETIGMRVFSGCPLTTIKIGKNAKTIEEDAFKGIKEIPEVYFAGSEEEWKNISIDQSNDMILRANMHYNADITHTHSYTSKITKAATCIADGVTTYTCSCGDKYTKPIAKTGHKLVTDKAVAATCTKTGKTEGKHCSVCGTVTVAQKTVAKKAHTYKATTTKATIAKDGKTVTACTVCGKVSETTPIYKASSIQLSATVFTYNAKVQRPTVTVKNSKGTTLKNGTDYTMAYSSGCKNPGKYAVKVTFKGNYTGSKTLYFTILPGITSSIATTTNSSAIKLTWKAVPGATGYRVFQYDTKTKKYVTVKTLTGTSYTVSKLKSGTTYKFAVKAYSTVNGTVYWASGYKTVTATTNPGTPTLTVAAGAKKATLKWTKRAEATGYVVYMATSKTGKYTKIATIKSNGTVSMTKTGLTTGKTYYFKVAAYKTVSGKNIYSSYSSTKYVKIK